MAQFDSGMFFNDLLGVKGFDPKTVLLMRHRPKEASLRSVFHQLAIMRPDLYNTYQSTHYERQEKQLSKATYLASFIGHRPGKALFIGFFRNGGSKAITHQQYWKIKENNELHSSYGMKGFDGARPTTLLFNLKLLPVFADWKGRLVIEWSGGRGAERSWSRWASDNDFAVEAINEKTAAEPEMPPWDDLLLDWLKLSELWPSWQSALRSMRGVYFIFDKSDNKGYVGSACGAENILGRWMQYAKTGHGGNKLLRQRDHKNFRFSILELVAPSLPPDELIKKEQSWKRRLSTIAPNGLNEG
jgi:hypothetical protein